MAYPSCTAMIHQFAAAAISAVAAIATQPRRGPAGHSTRRMIQATSSAPSIAIQLCWRSLAVARITQIAAKPAHAPSRHASRNRLDQPLRAEEGGESGAEGGMKRARIPGWGGGQCRAAFIQAAHAAAERWPAGAWATLCPAPARR